MKHGADDEYLAAFFDWAGKSSIISDPVDISRCTRFDFNF
jgi:hypothetical protein